MANVLPTDIKTFKEAVAWFLQQSDYPPTKVSILVELYQSKNPLYPKDEGLSGDTSVTGGVCAGMALEWINKNRTVGGGDSFRTTATKDWESFANAQINLKHNKLTIKLKMKELMERKLAVDSGLAQIKVHEDYGKQTGLTASLMQFVSPPKTNIELNKKTMELKKEMLAVATEAKDLQVMGDKIYAKRSGDTSKRVESLQKDLLLSQVVTKIQSDQGSQPAFYLINFNTSSTVGHTVAIHAGAAPRLLDANSCEFSFDSMATLYAFLADYWQIYERSGFAQATVEVMRFDE